MSTIRWQWRPGRAGYAAHLGSCTAWIQLATEPDADGLPRIVRGAKDAGVFTVAIVVPGRPTERYRLRAPLEVARSKLAAALARRHDSYRAHTEEENDAPSIEGQERAPRRARPQGARPR